VRRPNPGRTLASARKRLRGAAGGGSSALARVGRAIVRVPRAIGLGMIGFWRGLSIYARRRLVAALGVVVVLLAFFGLAVPNLPCQLPGGETCPPADDAQELVPADALAYLHANLDPETVQYERAADIADRIPIFSRQVADRALAQLPGAGGAAPDFEREVRPWFAGEAAVAVIGGTGRAERVELLEVSDAEGATEFATAVGAGSPRTEEHRGVELTIDRRGVAAAQVEGFLAIGPRDGVRAVIDTATGADEIGSLAEDETAEELRDELPDHRLVEAYLSEDGVGELIAADRGTLGTLTPLLAPGATRGAAAGLVATEDGLELSVRSALDPERAESSPGFFAAFPPFEPAVDERLAAGTLGYVGIGEPRRTVRALLAQATTQAPGIAAGFEDLVRSLRRQGEIDVERELLDALGGEAAFVLARRSDDSGPALPFVEFVADNVDEEAARRALASLQGPVVDAVGGGGGGRQAPVFGQQQIGDVQARSLRISPTVELTYAVFDGLAAIATDPAGIERLVDGEGGLDSSELYERATEDLDDEVSLLAYLDLGGLVELAESLGLAEDPVYATFAGEFRRLEALGLAVSDDDELLSTDARLLVSEPEASADELESLAPPSD
jgi:Protein of unknown function (DUF3352)